ncbi:MAG: MBL fold metallo-hydrolase, partial [Chloroflexi bacterium]|nr:MBL fold metallo-hydrolase [Chloroflexota bacterium]
RREETYSRNRNFPFDPREIDAVILSHAHIDHSGNLPHFVKNGYAGPIYATHATADLADVMLRDSGHIQESDAVFVNKKESRHGGKHVEPLYTMADAELVAEHFQGMGYGQSFEPVPGVIARFWEAGHILGSAGISLDIEEKGRKFRFWFSGDIGRMDLPLLRDPVMPEAADYLLMESTYGDKSHDDPRLAFEEFRQVVSETIERGGKVIVPAFAVGRTQELVFYLNEMMSDGVRPVPVYVDSPLAVHASDIFRAHPECFDQETREFIKKEKHPALDFKQLTYIHSVDESKALNERKDPMIIISASGMAEAGRILHHLRNNIGNRNNTILIVGWTAPYTLGRRLADREKQVRIFGEPYDVKAQVATIGGLSGHAGQNLLVKYAASVKGQVKQVFLVHGEQTPAMALKEKLAEQSMREVYYPEMHSSVEI